MNRNTKKFVAKTGLAIGLGLAGKFVGPEILDDSNPNIENSKPTTEWVGELLLLGSGVAVARRGVAIGAGNLLSKQYEKDQQEAERLKSLLPQISEFKDPSHFYDHLTQHDPARVEDFKTTLMLQPLIDSTRRSGGFNKPFDLETLTWTVREMQDEAHRAIVPGERTAPDIVGVIDAAWFLDQVCPISPLDESAPMSDDGIRHWYDYVVTTRNEPITTSVHRG